MTRDIGVDAVIEKIRVKEVASPATPGTGYGFIYAKTDGLYFKGDGGVEIGPMAANSGLSNSNISPTTVDITASVNTRYFADVSGLTADRNFKLPSGAVGNEIELNITVGDDAFEFIVIGDTGITINGGSAATEWSRLFISGESVRLIATSTTNWQVVHDGRISCFGLMTLSANDTTNTAATATLPTWDNKVHDVGNLGDTTNKRFTIRRAGIYKVSGLYRPVASLTDGEYIAIYLYLNGTGGTLIQQGFGTASDATAIYTVNIPPIGQLCAVGDYIDMWFQSERANMGISSNKSHFQIEES